MQKPVVEVPANKVEVVIGEVQHPMAEEHYIEWIALETEQGMQLKKLNPGEEPTAIFRLNGEKTTAAYAYCNLHGLWKTESSLLLKKYGGGYYSMRKFAT